MTPTFENSKPGRSEQQQFDNAEFHRWYNFVLGYPDHLVRNLFEELSVMDRDWVYDPFCGTGTTLIECAKNKIHSVGVDANPFAVFAAKAKSNFDLDSLALERAARRVIERYRDLISRRKRFTSEVTYLYLNESGMIERGWISPKPLQKALALRESIRRTRDINVRNALMLALVADLPQKIGNMKFGPQIYKGAIKTNVDLIPLFEDRVISMIEDLGSLDSSRSYLTPHITLGDARSYRPLIEKRRKKMDFIICSPPYPTEHDYTRHTRLELAFIDSVSTAACVQKIKRGMIRSHTKGIYKGDDDKDGVINLSSIEALAKLVEQAVAEKQSGFERLYPTVVRSYFGGMLKHFRVAFESLQSGGKAAYVVGDQAAYLQIQIPTAKLLAEVAEVAGFKVSGIKLWRRRWATGISRHLDENILVLTKP